MKNLLLTLLFVCTTSFSQTNIVGYIFDKTTNKPLSYVAIIFGNSKYYTITNEDGKFELQDNIIIDSLEIRHLGYKSVKVPISYFIENQKLYIIPNITELDEVIVLANKNFANEDHAYTLLKKIIKKYRRKKHISKSKAFFSLSSSSKDIPIELIEGFYNSSQSLSEGLINLKLKSGRFGQNKTFPFYSLANTSILKNFTLFKRAKQILPNYPGNLALSFVKKKYSIKIDNCLSCNNEDISISFVPKIINKRLFSGQIILNEKELIIKRIELFIKDSISTKVISIDKNDTVIPKEIYLNIHFNPIDYNKIQDLDFTFNMIYHSQSIKKPVQSHTYLYFYENNNAFKEPYFTSKIHFRNDYDKIIASIALDDFWNTNYPFPRSNNYFKSMDYFKNNGYLFNYENYIPTRFTQYVKHSVIVWDKSKSLEWESIKKNDLDNNYSSETIASRFDNLNNEKINNLNDERLNFTYSLNLNRNKTGNIKFITRTLFDRNISFYAKKRTKEALIYINLIFDIYENYRKRLNLKIKDNMTFNKAKRICDIEYLKAKVTVQQMKFETNYGSDFETLQIWSNRFNSKLKN